MYRIIGIIAVVGAGAATAALLGWRAWIRASYVCPRCIRRVRPIVYDYELACPLCDYRVGKEPYDRRFSPSGIETPLS